MHRFIAIAMLAIGCARDVRPVVAVAHAAERSAACDPAHAMSLVEEAGWRRALLARTANAERDAFLQTGVLDGMPIDCPGLAVLARDADVRIPARDGDELVFQTAACAELTGRSRDAIARYEMLRTLYPRSQLVLPATLRVANLYARIGTLDGAAARLEDYARKFAGEKNAPDALADAAAYRAMLADDPARRDDETIFDRDFGRKERAGVLGNLRERRLLACSRAGL